MPFRWFSTLSWPRLCPVCRSGCNGTLCTACLHRFAAPALRCSRCALRLPGDTAEAAATTTAASCGTCLQHPPPQAQAVAAVDYAFPWAALIADLKFHGQPELAQVLAPLLSRASLAAPTPDLVLPLPLSPQGLARRGFNQAWELARWVAKARRLPTAATLLQRPLDLPHQSQLDRAQRLANLRGAFYVPPAARPHIEGRRVALVDDVMTTGATAHEATQTLLRAGARAVDLWVLARTPAPGDGP
jgi:ComF family protein